MSVVLGNRFELMEAIDEGGMSRVYTAWCRKTKKVVAIKVLRKELSDNPVYIKAFRKEAYTVMRLHHRNIVRILDIGNSQGYKYIAMEYIDGPTLKRKIEEEGPLPLELCVELAEKLCGALDYAHHRGIIHKDLKPANILLREDGEPILTDFGIAEEMDEEKKREEVFGSVRYFSPEQAKGEPVDHRTDIYSLGIILYEMTTGRLPFEGEDNLSIALKHLHMQPREPRELNPEIPESLNRIILKAMAKDRENRYSSIAAMQRDLAICLEEPNGEYVSLPGEYEKTPATERRSRRMRRLGIGLALGGLVALVAVVCISLFGSMGQLNSDNKEIYMPTLTEHTMEEAKGIMDKLGIALEITYEPNAQILRGYVVSQKPEPGTVLEKGDRVSIVVSSGIEVTSGMPGILGMSEEEARAAIDKIKVEGIRVVVLYEVSAQDKPGAVIQQQPAEGEPLEPGSVVTFVVNSEADAAAGISVPNLTGETMEAAVTSAKQAGFTSVWIYPVAGQFQEYQVLEQTPGYDHTGAVGQRMELTVQEAASGKNLTGTLELPAEAAEECQITLTVSYAVGGVECEFVAFQEAFPSREALEEKYGEELPYSVKVRPAEENAPKKLNIYIDGDLLRQQDL